MATNTKDNTGNLSSTENGTIKIVAEDSRGRATTLRLNNNERVNFKEDMAADMLERNFWVRLYMTVVWVLSSGVMAVFIYNITTQYLSGLSTPSSSISIFPATELAVPKVVVCNWNQDGSPSDPTPTHNCSECILTIVSCTDQHSQDDCVSSWVKTPIQTEGGLFDCLTYNGDPNNALWSNFTGYSGSISAVFEVVLYQSAAPPVASAGVQVSFIILDDTPTSPDVIYNEVQYGSIGADSFFAITYINTIHDESNRDSNTPYNSSRYDAVSSSVSLNTPYNDTVGYAAVSFSFQTLSQEQANFFTSYTLVNFWGDFAGMIGTLMGLDLIKFASGIPKMYLAVKLRSINPIEDHFNG